MGRDFRTLVGDRPIGRCLPIDRQNHVDEMPCVSRELRRETTTRPNCMGISADSSRRYRHNGVAMTTKGLRPLVNHAELPVLKDMPARPHIIGVSHLEVVARLRWIS